MVAVPRSTECRLHNGAVELNYAEIPGDGPKVLLLHGLTARWQVFAPLIRGLREHAHLYALDFRGHGRSGWAPGRYLLVDYLADAQALLHRIGAPVIVYGHSLGGWVALSLAAECPGEVGGVIVADSVIFPERLGPDRDDLAELPAALRSMTTSLGRLDPEVMLHFRTRAAENYDPRTLLPRVACPTLLLQGDQESGGLMTDEDVHGAVALLPSSSHARFEGLGHGLHVEDAERVLQAVVPFIRKTDPFTLAKEGD